MDFIKILETVNGLVIFKLLGEEEDLKRELGRHLPRPVESRSSKIPDPKVFVTSIQVHPIIVNDYREVQEV